MGAILIFAVDLRKRLFGGYFGEICKNLGIKSLSAERCRMHLILVKHSAIPSFIYMRSDRFVEVDISASAFSDPVVFMLVVYFRSGWDGTDYWYNIVV